MCICGNIALWNAYGTTDPIKTDQPRIGDKFWWRNTFWCPVYRWCPHRHTAHQYWWGKILAGRILCPRDIRPGRHKYMHRVRNGSFLQGRSPPRPMHIRCHFMPRYQSRDGRRITIGRRRRGQCIYDIGRCKHIHPINRHNPVGKNIVLFNLGRGRGFGNQRTTRHPERYPHGMRQQHYRSGDIFVCRTLPQ